MKQYLDLAEHILRNGKKTVDRTGTGTLSSFGHRLEFDMDDGFPLVTTKKINVQKIWHELLWMLKGTPSAKYLQENGVKFWDPWIKNGELGRVYGVQWRSWRKDFFSKIIIDNEEVGEGWDGTEYIDQLRGALLTIKENPTDRRMVVTAWNPGELDEMALPPCHLLYQFYVDGDRLDIQVYQRSADVFLGLPFDIASYATLLNMCAYITDKIPGRLIYILGDAHIYNNHLDQMWDQVTRQPYDLPWLSVDKHRCFIKNIDSFTIDDLELTGYNCHEALKGDISV